MRPVVLAVAVTLRVAAAALLVVQLCVPWTLAGPLARTTRVDVPLLGAPQQQRACLGSDDVAARYSFREVGDGYQLDPQRTLVGGLETLVESPDLDELLASLRDGFTSGFGGLGVPSPSTV